MSGHYRVEPADGGTGCAHCGAGKFWDIVSGRGMDEVGTGTSYGDQDAAQDICDLMNMAFDAGVEAQKKEDEINRP